MCNAALSYAKEMWRAQHVRDTGMFGVMWREYKRNHPDDVNSHRLLTTYGLYDRMMQRRQAERDREFGNITRAVNIDGFGYVVTKENMDGTARVTRRYTDYFTATAILDEWQDSDGLCSAYSPTGQWFTNSVHIKQVRDNVWMVITCRMLDC